MTDRLIAVHELIPYAHVRDLVRSIEFYELLGFQILSDYASDGVMVWALLESGEARLMIAIAGDPIDQGAQGVLFYCYSSDVQGLRVNLEELGIGIGSVTFPDYMPHGELRVEDPDGYVILIGQLSPLQPEGSRVD